MYKLFLLVFIFMQNCVASEVDNLDVNYISWNRFVQQELNCQKGYINNDSYSGKEPIIKCIGEFTSPEQKIYVTEYNVCKFNNKHECVSKVKYKAYSENPYDTIGLASAYEINYYNSKGYQIKSINYKKVNDIIFYNYTGKKVKDKNPEDLKGTAYVENIKKCDGYMANYGCPRSYISKY